MGRHLTKPNGLPLWIALSLSLHLAFFAWCPSPTLTSPPYPIYLVVDLFSGPADSGSGSGLDHAPAGGGNPAPTGMIAQNLTPETPPRSAPKTKPKTTSPLLPTKPASASEISKQESPHLEPETVSSATAKQVVATETVKPTTSPALEVATEPLTGIPSQMEGGRTSTTASETPPKPGTGNGSGSGSGSAGSGSPVKTPLAYGSNPPPPYPTVARRRGWEGEVMLLVHVTAEGEVCKVEVNRPSGYRILDRAATRSVYRWRFRPALLNGRAVAGQVMVPIRFSIKNAK